MTHAPFDVARLGLSAADRRGIPGPARRWLNAGIRLAGAAGIAMVLAAAASPEGARSGSTIQGTDAAVTQLAPGVGAFTYWLNGPGGEVVTLVRVRRNNSADARDKGRDFVFRFAVVLVPGQTQTISVPGIDWGNPPTLRIRRTGETIEVTSSNTDSTAASAW